MQEKQDKPTGRRNRRTVFQATPQAGAETTAKRATRARTPQAETDSSTTFSSQDRLRMIESAAYFRAERRGFTPGHEIEDWLAAESEIDTLIAAIAPAQRQQAVKASSGPPTTRTSSPSIP
jgi:hypothetical protein